MKWLLIPCIKIKIALVVKYALALKATFALGLALLLTACGGSDQQSVWGTYQEPIAPQVLPAAAGTAEINVLWRKNIGAGAEQGYAILTPSYSRNRAGMYAASRSGNVFKIDARTGATLWQRNLNATIFSAVGADAAIAVVALDDGKVVALNADTGDIVWQTPLNRQISAIPVVGAGRVVVRTAGGLVLGLHAATGEIVWSIKRTVPRLSIHGDSAPAISDDVVFVGLANGKLLTMNVISGREYWEREISLARGRNELERLTDADTSPLVTADTVYSAAYQGNVTALQLPDAAVKWRAKVSSRLPMSLGGGKLFVTNELGGVVAMDAASGAILWTQEAFHGRGMSRPLAIGSRVIVGDADGNIYALDINDGTLLEAKKVTGGTVLAVVAGQRQFTVFSSQGDLVALSLDEGEN